MSTDETAATTTRARSTERTTFLADILCAALEGGIGYWSQADDIVRVDAPDELIGWRYDAVTLFEVADGDDYCSADGVDGPCPGHRVTLDTVAHGVSLIGQAIRANSVELLGMHYSYVRQIREASFENDGGEIDADLADMIVQVGVFGEVIYG